MKIYIMTILMIAATVACTKEKVEHRTEPLVSKPLLFVLTWPNYDGVHNDEAATYTLDGEPIGNGHRGYLVLLERIKKMPTGSTLEIQFQPRDGNDGGVGYTTPLSFENKEIFTIAENCKIKLKFPPGGAGWH